MLVNQNNAYNKKYHTHSKKNNNKKTKQNKPKNQ